MLHVRYDLQLELVKHPIQDLNSHLLLHSFMCWELLSMWQTLRRQKSKMRSLPSQIIFSNWTIHSMHSVKWTQEHRTQDTGRLPQNTPNVCSKNSLLEVSFTCYRNITISSTLRILVLWSAYKLYQLATVIAMLCNNHKIPMAYKCLLLNYPERPENADLYHSHVRGKGGMSNTSQLIWTNYGYKRRTTTTPFRASHTFQEASPEVLSGQQQKCERASGSMSTPGILTQMGTPWRLLHSAGHNKSSCRFKLWDGEAATTSFSARSCSHRTKNIVAKNFF